VDRLAEHFVKGISQEHGLGRKELTEEARQVLRTHAWLGNVRELKNVLESALVMSDGVEVRPEHIRLRKRATVAVPGDVILAHGSEGQAGDGNSGPTGGPLSVGNGDGTGSNGNGATRDGQSGGTLSESQAGVVWLGSGGDGPSKNGAWGAGRRQDDGSLVRVPPGGVTLEEVERALLEATLELSSGNRSAAARMLGISRPTVIRKIKQYGLKSNG
jgi:DNA-binding NtrC family response regulator